MPVNRRNWGENVVVNAWVFFYPTDLNKGIQTGVGGRRWQRYCILHIEKKDWIIKLRLSIIICILIVSDRICLDPITF